MDYQSDMRRYLTEVQEWLVVTHSNILEQRWPLHEENVTLLERTKEKIKFQLKKQDIEQSILLEIQESIGQINDIVQSQINDQERIHDSVPIGQHVLPPLPYGYDALEPYINLEIMKLHYTKHHKSYVDGLNKAEKMMKEARDNNKYDLIKHWEREAAFHGSGHYLHCIFWEVINPRGGGQSKGELLQQIQRDFGSYDMFKKHFSEAAKKVEGVGWAILVWSPRSRKLEILQAERHQLLTQWDIIPLLVLDVWEHAYYLQYKNERDKYVDNWWHVVYWPNVEKRYQEARKLKWQPY
jgi:superoxide dismutase, Fe-Mn family